MSETWRIRTAALVVVAAVACGSEPEPRAQRSARTERATLEQARSGAAPAEREWRTVLADPGASHASPLSQIRRDNVAQLKVAWLYDSGDASHLGISEIQCNPIVVDGVLYGTSPSLRLFALEAATGREIWSFRPNAELDPPSDDPNRGVVYFDEGNGSARILYTAGRGLYAVDAHGGTLEQDFGDAGRVDLRTGLGELSDDAQVAATTPGTIFEDLLILGSRVSEWPGAAPGYVRAFDARTGELRWVFHTIPKPGEPGYETWPPDAWKSFGGANSWAGISVDAERGIAFVPTGSPSLDFRGVDRAGDNLFGNTLLALDARTGERRWHYQIVRHDLWDRDLPAAPNLIELERGGRKIPAVAQVTKTGHVFVFHRETGVPLFPIEEVPVVGTPEEGEVPARSQPIPVRPPPFTRQGFTLGEVADRSPEIRAAVTAQLQQLNAGPLYPVPEERGAVVLPGMDGGAEWGGAAWDAETQLLYVNANEVPFAKLPHAKAAETDGGPADAYSAGCAACHGEDRRGDGLGVPSLRDIGDRLWPWEVWEIVKSGRGRMPPVWQLRWYEKVGAIYHLYTAADNAPKAPSGHGGSNSGGASAVRTEVPSGPGWYRLLASDGLPAAKPPWGTLTALDLAKGEIAWRIPLGDDPRALELGWEGLGSENYGGPIVTAGGLLFIAATADEHLRAFDKLTGELLWKAKLPAGGFATPSTYEAGGRQFVVVAAGGGKLDSPSTGIYIAYALPER